MEKRGAIKISTDFTGGNALVLKCEDDTFFIEPELRDTEGDWFYWAFCADGTEGSKLNIDFGGKTRVGYYGPAVSRDLINWEWLGPGDGYSSFRYEFKSGESRVYFAHHMLYHPERFRSLARQAGIGTKTLCVTPKGRSVPFCEIGRGEKIIFLTARHHSCESSGSYALEGFLDEYAKSPIAGTRVICVPFMDFDGAVDGDQGKNRRPHDHGRDYAINEAPLYDTVRTAMEIIGIGGVAFGIDFHSPWHFGGQNDTVFAVRKKIDKARDHDRFGLALDKRSAESGFRYRFGDDMEPDVDWNDSASPCVSNYIMDRNPGALAFGLEIPYFRASGGMFTPEGAVGLGRSICGALADYLAD
ncbi:MAG: hypothetical protein FWF03_08550 [Defluviitaleaceae bacterium]|nr:hypothetical protein [Defluviitaleaceae bacterium]